MGLGARTRAMLAATSAVSALVALSVVSCSAATERALGSETGGAGGVSNDSGTGGVATCGSCTGHAYVSCDGGEQHVVQCPAACTPDVGCTACSAANTQCVGSEVHECDAIGQPGKLVQACNTAGGEICDQGVCKNGCAAAAAEPSNIGCEFWSVDLDMADLPTDPASAPMALVIANAGQADANVLIEQNDAPQGSPVQGSAVWQGSLKPGELSQVNMPTREVDCGAFPNDHDAPGTCLSSAAFHITSTAPIVIYQFNNVVHNFSTDASLLIPTTSLGTKYRVIGWPAAHSFPSPGAFVERSYITVVGTQSNTHVTVWPYWRIKGNAPIASTPAGTPIEVEIGPFDVLNLESDDSTFQECFTMTAPPYCADMTGSVVLADKPVAVFSGTESSGIGLPEDAPLPPTWNEESGGCCLQHLEEQLFPLESIGMKYVITRSPVRSQFSSYQEPDILRFVGAAETAQVTTNLPPPFDQFTIAPGDVKETWTQSDTIVSSDKPILVGQFLVAQDYVSGTPKGDPSFTLFPPVEQARAEYVFLSPEGWSENFVVIAAEVGTKVAIDNVVPSDCDVNAAGTLDGKSYESRRCPIPAGVHRLSGDAPFGITAYGYGNADTYSFVGGAAVKKIYEPPIIR